MLKDGRFHAAVAISDPAQSRKWYEDKLGLKVKQEDPGGVWYQFGNESWLYVYQSGSAGSAKNTVGGWAVDDLAGEMNELRRRGVVFEEYDMPGLKTVDGVVDFGPAKVAWFKDPDGNTFELSQVA
jgi:catechol 2,3-dioxygenase-like lactoylglutathione lyase family enzyme